MPYQHSLGRGPDAHQRQHGPATAIMLAVLISPASDMSASTRASLYRELLLRYRPGPKAARMPLDRLRDDIGALAPPVRKELTDETARSVDYLVGCFGRIVLASQASATTSATTRRRCP
jgi:hypothetical protein